MKPYRLIALVPMAGRDAGDPMGAVAAAQALSAHFGSPVEAVLLGADTWKAPADCGAATVWLCSHPGLGAEPQAEQLLAACEQALSKVGVGDGRALILLPAGALGDELAARLAHRFDGAALGQCSDLRPCADGIAVTRAAYGGRVQLELTARHATCFATMRASKASGAAGAPVQAQVTPITLDAALPNPYSAQLVDSGERQARLEGARIVVSGGRGMGGSAGFSLLDELAGCLGGAVGGSLPTVDAGLIPVSRQVGQSGRYVAPEVYLAVAISGTPQHMAGVDPGARVVAINSDPEADIFKFAEIGMVEDWRVALPALIEQLRSRAC